MFLHTRQARLGIEDLVGNVWEWYESLYYPWSDTKNPNALWMLRGGFWNGDQVSAGSAYRLWSLPNDRLDLIGFRVMDLSSWPGPIRERG